MDLPVPPARASADSKCSRVKQLNNFFKAELSSGYFYTWRVCHGNGLAAARSPWVLCPAYIIPKGTRANGIKLPLIAAQPISAIYYIVISPCGCLTLPFSIPVSHLIRYQIPHHWPGRSSQTNLAGESCPQNGQSQKGTMEPRGLRKLLLIPGITEG